MKTSNTANRLNEILIERNMKQADLLRLTQPYCKMYNVKMNKSDISQYCSGKVEPNQDKLFVLSSALNVNVAWLMGYDVPSEPPHFSSAKKDICIYKALTEGLHSFNWDIEMVTVDDNTVHYVISNDACSITVSEEYIDDIEKRLQQFLLDELRDVFVKQNDVLFKEENNNSNTVFFSDVKEAKRFLEKEKDIAFGERKGYRSIFNRKSQ